MNKRNLFIWMLILMMVVVVIDRFPITSLQHTIAADDLETAVYLPFISKPAYPPEIVQFVADKEVADPGDTIQLYWEINHSITNTLYHLSADGRLSHSLDVESTGTLSYTIPINMRNVRKFVLYAGNDNFPWTSALLSITLNCPYGWFFTPAPNICAQDAAIISPAAEQSFEHGTMIWVQEEDLIYVLFDDDGFTTRYSIFVDEWEEGDLIDDPNIDPPPGFYQPKNGFGLVWREQATIRDRLGWATAEEVGFETAVQRTSYPKYNEIYILALDNGVWRLFPERSGWEKIIPIR